MYRNQPTSINFKYVLPNDDPKQGQSEKLPHSMRIYRETPAKCAMIYSWYLCNNINVKYKLRKLEYSIAPVNDNGHQFLKLLFLKFLKCILKGDGHFSNDDNGWVWPGQNQESGILS